MAGPTCSLALQTGLPDVCRWSVAMISLGKNSDSPSGGLWHHGLEKHTESSLSASWRFHLAGPQPWCSHMGDLGRVGAPSPLRWMGWCWLELLYSTMCMKLLLQASRFGDAWADSRNEADTTPGPQFWAVGPAVMLSIIHRSCPPSITADARKVLSTSAGTLPHKDRGDTPQHQVIK